MARPPRGPNQPPLSFKTVPGRHRTQKWNTAKTYDYSGDDWGGYDEYDEYNGYEQPNSAPAAAPPQQQFPQQGRSGRHNSFDQGVEQRQFSAGPVLYGSDNRGFSPAQGGPSGPPSNDYPRPGSRPRDFTNPEQVPAPLNTRAPFMQSGPATAPPAERGGAFPPRGASLSSGSPAPEVIPTSAKAEKELPTPPFIRPSDIYKRMAAAQEQERRSSQESAGRPSMDSLQRETDSPASATVGRQQRPLSSVEESADSVDASPQPQQGMQVPQGFGEPDRKASPSLPPLQAVSGFGSDMFGSRASEDDKATPKTAQSATAASTSSLQSTPTVSRTAPVGTDFAHPMPQPAPTSGNLSHQPSSGYRSMVNTAFDNQSFTSQDPNMSRSNTSSTGGVSPIMSRVPSAATAQKRQQAWLDRNAEVPSIAEEPQSRMSSESYQIPRKPSPSHSRNESDNTVSAVTAAAAGVVGAGAVAAGVQQGYRRSLDPPSHDNSPARTPGVETAMSRRLSEGLTAETVKSEAPAVPDQGVEMMPSLEPGETPASEINEPSASEATSSLPTGGRARAGTDYSMREADIARAVNAAPEEASYSPQTAAAEQFSQNLFLQTHNTDAKSPITKLDSPTTASGRNSPAKGRVRDLADKYQDLHAASRRGSQDSVGAVPSAKSSWSNFHGSEEDLTRPKPQRHATETSNVVSESDYSAFDREGDDEEDDTVGLAPPLRRPEPSRPEPQREESFRPQLPGQWVSYRDSTASGERGTPAQELASPALEFPTPRASTQAERSEIDLTPTTRKVPLAGGYESKASSPLDNLKTAGTALGAAFLASGSTGHSTRDFGSAQPAAPVDQPEMQPKSSIGDLGYLQAPSRPWLNRGDTGNSTAESVTSSVSGAPPTPPAKDTPPQQSGFGSHYFTGAPLRTGRSREGSPALAEDPDKFGALRATPQEDDDSLRQEIERSLASTKAAEKQREDNDRTQDALDAPANAARVADGKEALPPAEARTSSDRPRILDQRFSWEKEEQASSSFDFGGAATGAAVATAVGVGAAATAATVYAQPTPRVLEPDHSPEIKPEMPYERPRSRGLHIMNADADDSEDDTVGMPPPAEHGLSHNLPASAPQNLSPQLSGPVSPISKSQENLKEGGGVSEISPSPLSEAHSSDKAGGVPSYYLGDHSGLEFAPIQSGLELAPIQTHDRAAPAPQVEEVSDEEDDTVGPAESSSAAAREEEQAPPPISKSALPPSPTSPTSPSKQKIPPFREILAIKSPADRIRTYDDTRQTFADMNTGLSDWLSGMLAQHPEHANIGTAGYSSSNNNAAALKSMHKANPSLAKIKGLSMPQRTASQTAVGAPMSPERIVSSGSYGGGGGGSNVDMDKLKQGGKDLMKGAGVLGGKVQGGAKGLLAKGRSRFGSRREGGGDGGGSKAPPSPPPSPPLASTPPPLPPTLQSDFAPAANDRAPWTVFTSTTNPEPDPPPDPPWTVSAASPVPLPPSPEPENAARDRSLSTGLQIPTLKGGGPGRSNSNSRSNKSSRNPSPSPSQTLQAAIIPPSRSQTQTPGSVSGLSVASGHSGNVLSRTLSRLRERSRSKSSQRSAGGSASRSRPSSMILLNSHSREELKGLGNVEDASPNTANAAARAAAPRESDSFFGSSVNANRTAQTDIPDEVVFGSAAAVVGGAAVGGVASMEADARERDVISPWQSRERDSAFPPHMEENAAVPSRLGVLPSPTERSFSIYAEDEHPPSREVQDHGDAPPAWPFQNQAHDEPQVPQERPDLAVNTASHFQPPPAPVASPSPVTPTRAVADKLEQAGADAAVEGDEEIYDARPVAIRTVSATRVNSGDDYDELYDMTPTVDRKAARDVGGKDERHELYDTTPTADRKFSRGFGGETEDKDDEENEDEDKGKDEDEVSPVTTRSLPREDVLQERSLLPEDDVVQESTHGPEQENANGAAQNEPLDHIENESDDDSDPRASEDRPLRSTDQAEVSHDHAQAIAGAADEDEDEDEDHGWEPDAPLQAQEDEIDDSVLERDGSSEAEDDDHDTLPLSPATDLRTSAAAAAAYIESQNISRPSTRQESDRVSEVSAEDHQETAEDGIESDDEHKTSSRRSSVSSLGHQDRAVAQPPGSTTSLGRQVRAPVQPPDAASVGHQERAVVPLPESESPDIIMSSQAVPAGPIGTVAMPIERMNQGLSAQDERFMNRSYPARPSPPDRPYSFLPLSRDSSGAMAQESLDTARASQATSVYLGTVNEPGEPAPTPQQPPETRNIEPDATMAEVYVHSESSGRGAPFRQIRRRKENTEERRSKGLSGLLGRSGQPSEEPIDETRETTVSSPPPASPPPLHPGPRDVGPGDGTPDIYVHGESSGRGAPFRQIRRREENTEDRHSKGLSALFGRGGQPPNAPSNEPVSTPPSEQPPQRQPTQQPQPPPTQSAQRPPSQPVPQSIPQPIPQPSAQPVPVQSLTSDVGPADGTPDVDVHPESSSKGGPFRQIRRRKDGSDDGSSKRLSGYFAGSDRPSSAQASETPVNTPPPQRQAPVSTSLSEPQQTASSPPPQDQPTFRPTWPGEGTSNVYVHEESGRAAPFRQIRRRKEASDDGSSTRPSASIKSAEQPPANAAMDRPLPAPPPAGPEDGNLPRDTRDVNIDQGRPRQEDPLPDPRLGVARPVVHDPNVPMGASSGGDIGNRADPWPRESSQPVYRPQGNLAYPPQGYLVYPPHANPGYPPPMNPAYPPNANVPAALKGSNTTGKLSKKPQRASTSAVDPEPKKGKRFSGLGSLFGRSSTTGHKTEKPKNIPQGPPPGLAGWQGQQPPMPWSNTAPIDVHKQQQILEWQQHGPPPGAYPPSDVSSISRQQSYSSHAGSNRESVHAPVEGWYAPQRRDQPTSPQTTPRAPPPQQYWQSQREGHRPDPYANVPVAFRPVESSYSRPFPPRGPPQGQQPPVMHSPPTSPVRSPVPSQGPPYQQQGPVEQRYNPAQPQPRQTSYGSNGSQLSQQVSGQSEWQRSQRYSRGSLPMITPVQTRTTSDGIPSDRDFRGGSLGEVARSPAREYPDQQTPWAITIPRAGAPSYSPSKESPATWAVPAAVPPTDQEEPDNPYQPPLQNSRAAQPPASQSPSSARSPQQNPYDISRDDGSDNEETPTMRGTSYPGQEWMPASWE